MNRRLVRSLGLCCLTSLAATGCLKPPHESSGNLYSSYIKTKNQTIHELESDEAAAKKLDANDGLSGSVIPLHTGFAGGEQVSYWDLGQLDSVSIEPMWIFRSRGSGTNAEEIGHPNLIDSIPGDSAYTPLRQVYVVFVTDAYDGQQFPSLRALEDGVELGLLEPPVAQDHFVNCVVTLSSVRLDQGDGEGTEPEAAYYRGQIVHQFCIGGFRERIGAFMLKNGRVSAGNAYLLRRQNQALAIDEGLFDADINEDGDQLDTNTIFDSTVGDENYVSVWHSVEVVVPPDYTDFSAKSQDDLFDKTSAGLTGRTGKVISFTDEGVYLNRPIKLFD